jgi:hypothetical protein
MPEPVHGNGRYVKSGHASPLPRRSATRHFPAPWARSPRTNAVVLRLGDVLVTAEQPCDLDVSGAATQLVNRRVAQVVHRVAGESGRHDAARARLVKRCPAFAETRIGLAHERLAPLDLPLCGGNFLHPFGRAGGGGVAPGDPVATCASSAATLTALAPQSGWCGCAAAVEMSARVGIRIAEPLPPI